MNEESQALMESLRRLWQIEDDESAARLERIAERLALLLPPEVFVTESTLAQNAAMADILEPDDSAVEDWVKEIEDPNTEGARRALLLETLAVFSERHGFHRAVAELVQRVMADENADDLVRAGAMRALARSRPPALVREWLKGLGDPEASVRLGAVTLLAQSKDPIALRPLAGLIAEGDPQTVQAAMWAIGEIGIHDPVVESVLVDALKARFCTPDAAASLGKIGRPEVLKILLQEAGRGDGLQVMMAVADLVERNLPVDIPVDEMKLHTTTLRRMLARHHAPAVRALAGVTLARLGQPVGAEEIEKALENPSA